MRLPQPTKEAILSLLRHRSMTITELCQALSLTRNAILIPLKDLRMRGLVRPQEIVRTGRKGKPSLSYEIVPEQVEQMSAAYQAIAPLLLEALLKKAGDDVPDVMKQLGADLHTAFKTSVLGEDHGLSTALRFLEQHGAQIETTIENGQKMIVSHSCPIGRLVRTDKRICSAVASFLSAASGNDVFDTCRDDGKLTCRFEIRPSDRVKIKASRIVGN
ncbi:ArsR family transcriptional regulator [Sinorhizobium meliloti]|uniref:ArsR family transcriptional regulator n=2 Tax=Sinorhizobium TaxID=28105 RepID=A0ABY8T8D0_9HYPH|nr:MULTISPECIES: ArsR family transcriptional regulator [Sinorhizobium]EHK76369.1 putative transcriptional regulator [Sinorhizobium meliloti CCNWSX0020]MDW9416387.1 ArsR family transcriptional regulator [Sinorhizobium meliloti]MDW9482463.1 ArsR family transcriptional regulator [Sinorhizobium meliloti]MDW9513300.1 ArsR family transcriptional regulator [Sinorhizobium meliloti]MDW9594956.1 ArsR family transcriptional regulator [Sinorhizobium meliloti]